MTTCAWTEDEDDTWETECGHAFTFIDGGVSDNSFSFCPFCGGKIDPLAFEIDEQPDE
jgi:hypothetical protein